MRRHSVLVAALAVVLAVGSAVPGVVSAAPAAHPQPAKPGKPGKPGKPRVTISPSTGSLYSTVTIAGKGFTAASKVRFGAVTATTTYVSATRIKAVVPPTARTGAVSVTTSRGTARSRTVFRVAPPGVRASVTTGPPTTRTTLVLTGFGAGEGVEVSFDTTTIALLTAGANGAVSATVTVPASASPGAHQLTAIGRRQAVSAHTTFTVRTNVAQAGYDNGHTGVNPYENQLSPTTIAKAAVVWRTTVPGTVNSTPAVVDGVVYASVGDGTVRAFNAATGVQKWSFATGGSTMFSSPTVSGGVVYVGSSDHKLYALSASTGAKKWSYTTADIIFSSALVVGTTVYVGSYDHSVYALTTATGTLRWSHALASAVYGAPSYHDGRIYVGDFSGNAVALSAATGAQVWSVAVGQLILAPLSVSDGLVFVTAEGSLYALDEDTGVVEWTTTATSDSAAVGDGLLVVADTSGVVTAYAAATGSLVWTRNLSTSGSGALRAPTTIANGLVLVGYEYTFALRESDGALLRTFTDGAHYGGTTVSDGTITVGNSRRHQLVRYALPATVTP